MCDDSMIISFVLSIDVLINYFEPHNRNVEVDVVYQWHTTWVCQVSAIRDRKVNPKSPGFSVSTS